MKIAIVHDDIVRKGGGEQVALSFHKAFPDAPVYTLSYSPKAAYPEFRSCNIKTSWFGRFIKGENNMKRFFFPLGVWAMQGLTVKGYDVILQSTTHCAKYIKTDPGTLIITYCHTPFRLVWRPDTYENVVRAGFIKKRLYHLVISILKKIDKNAAKKTDWFITNAREVVPRIKAAYNPVNDISIMHPPVKCKNFYISDTPDDYYLVVSRFEPYKKVDLVIETFNEMPGKKLIIVGKGTMEKELKGMAKGNITFLTGLDAAQLADLYAGCKALIFPQLEDYGIVPLEANASGRPVIAYGRGGITDTMIPVREDASKATALFFSEQTNEALKGALAHFECLTFSPAFIRSHAETFDEAFFVEKIRSFVAEKNSFNPYGTFRKEYEEQVAVG